MGGRAAFSRATTAPDGLAVAAVGGRAEVGCTLDEGPAGSSITTLDIDTSSSGIPEPARFARNEDKSVSVKFAAARSSADTFSADSFT